jgi:D-alanyl-lipoteichoic acid acyltransferase DltB (MBOAT superfamily)
MLFNSLEFAVFFPVVTALYFLLSPRARVAWLLGASCLFYMAFVPAYVLIIAATILIDYTAALYLEPATGGRRRALLIVSITATCAILFFFKYFAFFTDTFVGLAALAGWHATPPLLQIVLPIGLSFHTFQSLSYVIEVYRGRQVAERDLTVFATYVMFFPQLVAGPIERPQNLLGQFREHHTFDYDRVTSGLKRMAWGFFKKLVVADRLALYVNDVYGSPRDCNGLQLTIATVFFAYQIYCDFSGYSDIAIGSARVLGFRLMENFDTPYASTSISEFWRRWHISLSTWFRDYLYIPLGGNRVSTTRRAANLLFTFGLSGLWHGANWTYVVWGLLNGFYLVFGWLTAGLREKAYAAIGLARFTRTRAVAALLTTFSLTCSAWIFFRARTLSDAGYIFSHLFSGWDVHALRTAHFQLRDFPAAIGGIVLLEILQQPRARAYIRTTLVGSPRAIRWPAYAGFIFFVVLFGVHRSQEFIYFQF